MKNILAILGICSAFAANAQNPGYFNRKNVVEFSANGQMPVFANFKYALGGDNFYKVKGDYLENSRDRFDFGFRVAYMRTLKRNLGIGLEVGYDYFSIQRENATVTYDNWTYMNYDFEKMDVTSLMIMPKLEFSNKGSVLPMGIAHQVGIGIRLVKPTEKDYHFAYGQDMGNGLPWTGKAISMPDSSKYRGDAVKGLTLMYAVNMRTPLTRRLFLNYGLRYTLNFMRKPYLGNEGNSFEMTQDEFQFSVRQRKQFSLIQASLGLSFAF